MDWRNNIPEEIEVYIVDFLSGDITEENEQKLIHWLKEDQGHQKLFDEAKSAWLIANNSDSISNTEKGWRFLSKEIRKREGKKHISHKKELETKFEIPLFLKVAVSILLFYFLGGLSWYYFNIVFDNDSEKITEIAAPLGSKSSVILPDGTNVTLNAGSKISYAGSYGDRLRDIHLEGEAFFDVVTNKNKPFIVNTSSIKITALGTSFNVKAYEGEETVQTTLVEGLIKIENDKVKDDYLYLEPNQVAVFKKSTDKLEIQEQTKQDQITANKKREEIDYILKKSSVILKIDDPKPYTSWKDDQLIITGESLGELATKLGRMYDVTFGFENDVVKNYSFKGTLEKETLEQVLNVIRLTAPIKYEVNNKNVFLSEDEELKEKYKPLLE